MPRESIGRLVNFVVGFGLAAFLLWLFFRDADWAAVADAVTTANVFLLSGAFLGHVASLFLRSWRWRLLLSPVKQDIPFAPIWRYFNIGFTVSSLLPGRLGELLRPYLLARDQGFSFSSGFATVVTERILDLLMVLVLFGTIFIFPDALGPNVDDPDVALLIGTIKGFGLIALVTAVVAIIFLAALKLWTDAALGVVRFLAKPLPERLSQGLERIVRAFADGLGGLKGRRSLCWVVGSTLLNWMVVTASFWIALVGFGFSGVPFHHTFFLLSVVALGVVVPTPAGTGTFHAAIVVVAGSLWGLSYNRVVSYAIVNHLVTFLPVVLFGIYYMARGNINIFAVAKTAQRMDGETVEQ